MSKRMRKMAKAININIVEENRPSLTSFGPLFGKRIFSAVKVPIFTDFNSRTETANHNNGLFITRNVYRYKVQAIDITSMILEKGIEDEFEIVINKDMTDENGNSLEVRCPLADPHFTKEVNTENLIATLNQNGGSCSKVFFSSGKKLTEHLNLQNAKERAKIDALKKDLEKACSMIDTTSDKNYASTEAYYRQLDGKKPADVTVHVNIDD
uniref:Uncharacterized protein n=1 Tax=Dulem virus 42 TaxID=3145760 RepID=A0AAU8B8T2_9CAUD